jgi:hypothetical protein
LVILKKELSNMATTPSVIGWVTTQAGLAAAASAQLGGLKIKISSFKLGSSFGYVPTSSDTSMRGTVVYTAIPNSWNKQSNGDLEVVVTIPADLGPFQFGEAGFYLDDGTLFAVAVWSALQLKAEVVANGVANILTFRARLKLGPNPAVFIVEQPTQTITSVATTAQVTGPDQMQGAINSLIVNESILRGDNIVLTRVSGTRWNCLNFMTVTSDVLTLVAGTDDILESNAFSTSSLAASTPISALLVQDAQGNVRTVNSIVTQNAINGKVTLVSR